MDKTTQRIIRLVLLSRKAAVYRELGRARGDTRRIVRATWLEEAAMRKVQILKKQLSMGDAATGQSR